MNYGEIIKKERQKQGLSKYRLAKMAGVTETAIRHWESGNRGIGIEYADKIFKALNISVTIGLDERCEEPESEVSE